MTVSSSFVPQTQRQALRCALKARHEAFSQSAAYAPAQAELAGHLSRVLAELEPQVLGLYWPICGEFNAVILWRADKALQSVPAALPFARREPREMHFRAWDGEDPKLRDECGIPTAAGAPVEPDVVVVPCVGFTRSGYRLGYGGGYFDRWLAAHPGTTAVGVAWAHAEVAETELAPQPHDQPLMLVITQTGVVG